MVVGSGLLANTFKSYRGNEDVIIFASGVSNSGCVDVEQFKRELNLVSKYKTSKNLFVYFSTSSIEDPFLKGSLYIKHKLEIEFYIKANFQRYLIVRLPNVVGKTKNPNTLINFVYNCVQCEDKIEIQLKASRYLIDVAPQLDGDKIEIFFNDTGSPALIKDPGDFDSIFVVMPMKG